MQDFVTSKADDDLGDIKLTGTAESGTGVAFEVTGWKSNKIWPHDQLFGILRFTEDDSHTMVFLEMVFADHAIT